MEEPDYGARLAKRRKIRFFIAILVIATVDISLTFLPLNRAYVGLESLIETATGLSFNGERLFLQTLFVFCIASIVSLFWLCRNLTRSPGTNLLIGVLIACIQGALAFLCTVALSFQHFH